MNSLNSENDKTDKKTKNEIGNYKLSENESVNSTLDISNTIEIDINLNQEESFEFQSFTSKKIGKCRIFLYYNGNPLMVIGPDCK